MTPNDVMRLYAMLDESRKETRVALGEVRDELQGYRQDLNGRLRTLETSEARRQGADYSKGAIGRMVLGTTAVSASIATVVTLVVKFV